MKRKNKGFTLIELLAVIVILAVIALIAVPQVLNIIENARKGAFARSADGILKASKMYYMSSQLDGAPEKTTFECSIATKECVAQGKVDADGNPIKLEMDGSVGYGTIDIEPDGSIAFSISDNRYCATKSLDSEKITVTKGACGNDVTAPIITLEEPYTTTNSIIIGYTIVEEQSLPYTVSCVYGEDTNYTGNSANVSVGDSACRLTNLTNGQKYYYKVCAVDAADNESCQTGEAIATLTAKPKITITSNPETTVVVDGKEFAKSQVANIKYETVGIDTPNRYFKSSKVGKSDVQLTACGTGVEPDAACSSDVVNANENFVANTWYLVSGDVNVTYSDTNVVTGSEPDVITAIISDGTSFGTGTESDLANLDNANPEVTVLTDEISTKSSTITIPFTATDAHSGVGTITCSSSNLPSGVSEPVVSKVDGVENKYECLIVGLSANTNYNYVITVNDNVGNNVSTTEASATTANIVQPTFTRQGYNLVGPLNETDNINDTHVLKDVITVDFTAANNNMASATNYINILQTSAATSNVQLQACGTGATPDATCSGSLVNANTALTADTWYKVSGSSVELTFTEYGEIEAYASDGANNSITNNTTSREMYITADTVTVSTLDDLGATIIETESCTPDASGNITLDCALDELYAKNNTES